jgi:hypothetical protein
MMYSKERWHLSNSLRCRATKFSIASLTRYFRYNFQLRDAAFIWDLVHFLPRFLRKLASNCAALLLAELAKIGMVRSGLGKIEEEEKEVREEARKTPSNGCISCWSCGSSLLERLWPVAFHDFLHCLDWDSINCEVLTQTVLDSSDGEDAC